MTGTARLRDLPLPSTPKLAALAVVTILIALAAVPIPSFSRLSNELRAFAGAGLALWIAHRLLGGLSGLFRESAAQGPLRRLLPALKTYAAFLLALLAALALTWGAVWAFGHFAGDASGADAYASWVQAGNAQKAGGLDAAGGSWGLWQYAWLLILAPVLEELFFRRLLYVWLRRRAGITLSTAVSAGLFGLLHAPAALLMLITAVLGAFLCRLYEKQQDYGACVAAHALNNLFSLFLFWLISPR